eukprot:CAMPEP_0184017062 /NCGR_PEP_ID=MMETSP0954-20121128/7299_1 /TAXON_ID=627963 /ORGANISM="Aplanochytrium sp, Strain PBS07" /LENGTH=394 /DNA_ID=CAMNT_0026298199 /DNA_START=1 /DNA_END=1182 /DNA_ORIENTATION=+
MILRCRTFLGLQKMSVRRRLFGQKRWYRIEAQSWSDSFSPLDRSVIDRFADVSKTNPASLEDAVRKPGSRFMFFNNGKVGVDKRKLNGESVATIAWRDWDVVKSLGLNFYELEDGNDFQQQTIVLLGSKPNTSGDAEQEGNDGLQPSSYYFAVDASVLEKDTLCTLIQDLESNDDASSVSLESPRNLLQALSDGDLSMVGQAVARLNWHDQVKYSRQSGRPMVPAGAGHRRVDPAEPNKRLNTTYPRINPVAIMLVTSPDGSKCLLGRTKRRHNSNMYSCLAGFVEQSESVEDAVRRETFEESGVVVGDHVDIVGSQAWPIGAGGGCELMIGCIARAETETINFDEEEMSDVRWFSRSEVAVMLERSREDSLIDMQKLKVPGSYAIAHHLIKAW